MSKRALGLNVTEVNHGSSDGRLKGLELNSPSRQKRQSFDFQSHDLIGACFRCKNPIVHGVNIYMYGYS